jgi:hypothetical protein
MMIELLNLWPLPDESKLNIRARYIPSVANVWADRLSRELDNDN